MYLQEKRGLLLSTGWWEKSKPSKKKILFNGTKKFLQFFLYFILWNRGSKETNLNRLRFELELSTKKNRIHEIFKMSHEGEYINHIKAVLQVGCFLSRSGSQAILRLNRDGQISYLREKTLFIFLLFKKSSKRMKICQTTNKSLW